MPMTEAGWPTGNEKIGRLIQRRDLDVANISTFPGGKES
jgi:hypothetical protein